MKKRNTLSTSYGRLKGRVSRYDMNSSYNLNEHKNNKNSALEEIKDYKTGETSHDNINGNNINNNKNINNNNKINNNKINSSNNCALVNSSNTINNNLNNINNINNISNTNHSVNNSTYQSCNNKYNKNGFVYDYNTYYTKKSSDLKGKLKNENESMNSDGNNDVTRINSNHSNNIVLNDLNNSMNSLNIPKDNNISHVNNMTPINNMMKGINNRNDSVNTHMYNMKNLKDIRLYNHKEKKNVNEENVNVDQDNEEKNLVETQNENDKRNEKKEEDDDEDVDEAEEKEEEGMKLLREKICFKMLKSIDIYITEIIMKSCFVTVYKMKDDELKWKRADIEGFLYIVKRSIKPYYRLIITNKKNEKHLLQDIDTNMNLSTDQNYIFYRIINEETNVRNIYSLWFYSTEEKEQIYKVLKNIVEKSIPRKGRNYSR